MHPFRKKIGILGGGQLGKMLCLSANNWSLYTSVLDPSRDCPASGVCSRFVLGDFRSYQDVYSFGKEVDILTIEIEHVNVEALLDLEREGVIIVPAPEVLAIIKDKKRQKQFYKDNGIPTPEFIAFDTKEEILKAIREKRVSIPFVQKARFHGYDGRGVKVVKYKKDLEELLDVPCIVEDLVNIKKEISVIVVRSFSGECRCFPPVEMVFSSDANLVEYLISPAELSSSCEREAKRIAIKTVQSFNLYGILAVEMFVDNEGNIFVNESAPRPHNSGHHTIESCVTSQYEQHLRTLLNLPIGDTRLVTPSVMVNILGEPGYEGEAKYLGLEDCLKIDGVKVHIYGKKITKPFRKMGHVTIIDESIKSALFKAGIVKDKLKVIA